MHPLKEQYYRSRYLATVRFIDSHSFTIEGGMPEKRALEAAKKEATFCYVKDITTKSEAKLELLNGQWVLSKG
jgi:fatty acid-binding protein DegV